MGRIWRFPGRSTLALIAGDFSSSNDHVMDFIGPVGKTERTLGCVHVSQWRPLRDTGSPVDLDGSIDNLTHPLSRGSSLWPH
jgi:hypothetical protein